MPSICHIYSYMLNFFPFLQIFLQELNKKFPDVEAATKSCRHKSAPKQVSPGKRPLTSMITYQNKINMIIGSSSDLDVAVAPSREEEHPEDAACCTKTTGAPRPAHTRAQSAGQSVAETLASGCGETEMSRTTSTSSQRGQSDVEMQSFRDILLNKY